MAQCPRCMRAMDKFMLHGIDLDVCSECRGIWFDAEELMQALRINAMELSSLPFYREIKEKEDPTWDQPPAFCPRCSSALEPQRFAKDLPVIVDVCSQEHGFWMDEGELYQIKRYCIEAARLKEECKDMDPEHRQKMMEKHRKSLRGFRITYGVPEPPTRPYCTTSMLDIFLP